ncbi:unnamed protein product [Leptosia nina]|uniref:U1-type domain-containing protein n=1 Tax=Leptosia nina TaxID=320188 RepID=A0AAV1IZI2_9NEOP
MSENFSDMAYYEDICEIENTITCILCKISLVNNSTAIELHINGENHKMFYIQRTLILNNMQGNYCKICNSDFLDLSHIQMSKHKEQLYQMQSLVEKDGAFIELPSNILQEWAPSELGTNSHCTICDQYLQFTFKDINYHINSHKHKRSKAMALQPFNGIISVAGSDQDLWCKICQKYFANYIEKIFEHVDDKDHFIKLNKIVRLIDGQDITVDNYLTNTTEDKATCNRCKTQVSCNVDNLERHIKGKRHTGAVKDIKLQ